MTAEWLPNMITILQIVVLIYIIVRSARLIRESTNPLLPVFFTFAMASFLLSDLYWIAYDLIRPDTRMPFAANEMGECACFLLLAASLSAVLNNDRETSESSGMPSGIHTAFKEVIFTAFFVAMNIALWIAWTGEWLQDIIAGAALGYLLCTVARGLKQTGAFQRKEWLMMGGACTLLVVMQVLTFFTHDGLYTVLDTLCYVLMFTVEAYFIIRCISLLRRPQKPAAEFCLALSALGWSLVTMYMSSGVFYYIGLLVNIILLPILLLSFMREVRSV